MVNVTLQIEQIKKEVFQLLSNLDDFSPVFKKFADNEYPEIVKANFSSKGQLMTREKWPNYVPGYAAWKKKHFHNKPMLEIEGNLKNKAVNFKSKIIKDSLEMTVEGEDYLYFVQERKFHPRSYFYTPDNDMPLQAWKLLLEVAENHLQKGIANE